MDKKSSYNFIKSFCTRVELFLQPLISKGVYYFSFSRVYIDGKIIFLCSDADWLTIKFDKDIFEYNGFFPDEEELLNNYDTHLFVGELPALTNNKLLELFLENNKWNSIDLYDRHSDYVDIGHFASTRDNTGILNYYINNLQILRHFFDDFKLVFVKEINQFLAQRYCLELKQFHPNNDIDRVINKHLFLTNNSNTDSIKYLYKEKIKEALSIIDTLPLVLHGRNIYLSPRESECFFLLARGKSYKEIAKLLKLSPRTIETHINNIKSKTGYSFKSDLINIFYQTYGNLIR